MGQISRALFICYPFVLHFCIALGYQPIAAWYLAVLLVFPLTNALVMGRRASVFELGAALVAVALVTVLRTHEILLFKLLPLTIYAYLFSIFVGSLRRGGTPLITRVALAINPAISVVEQRYTRTVTIAWAGYFLLMGAISLGLAVFASDENWSWFVNIISYGLTGLFFAAEFMLRRAVLGKRVDYNFGEFLGRLRRVDMRSLIFPGN